MDNQRLLIRVKKASVEALRRAGAYVRKVARHKVKTSDNSSAPGTPPNTRDGALKRSLLFGLDKKNNTVYVGSSHRLLGTALAAHEFGGKYKRERYPKRPLMQPALKQSTPKLSQFWKNIIKK